MNFLPQERRFEKLAPDSTAAPSPFTEVKLSEDGKTIRIEVPIDVFYRICLRQSFKVLEKRLSARQQQVLDLVRQRLSNKEIATRLNIAPRTASFHVEKLMLTFDVKSRHEL